MELGGRGKFWADFGKSHICIITPPQPGAIGRVNHLRVEGCKLPSLCFQIGKSEDDTSVGEAHHYPEMREVIKPKDKRKKMQNLKRGRSKPNIY